MVFDWLPFPLVEDYEVSYVGEVRNTITGKILKELPGTNGYTKYYLNKKWFSAHRVVAITWVDNLYPELHTQVNHKDGNKLNNHPSNLEWVSPSYNIKHAFETGLIKTTAKQKKKPLKKKVIVVNDGGNVSCYPSLRSCSEEINVNYDYLSKRVRSRSEGFYYKKLGLHINYLIDQEETA